LTGAEHLVGHFQKLIVHMVNGDSSTAAATASIPPEGISHSISVEPTASIEPEEERSHYVPLAVARVEQESDIITSFYLRRTDGRSLHTWEPGQFLPIRVTIPGQHKPASRTYTISTACNPDHYRLSIRRGEGDALVSQFLHDEAKPGFKLEAMAPHGRFVLGNSDRPVVLVSGGVGITPMVAMAEHIVAEGKRTGSFRPVYFVHGTQNGRVHAFREHIRALAADHPHFVVHISYSRPCEDDASASSYDAGGKISVDTLKRLLPFGDFEFYVCGPSGFMRAIYDGLTGMGISTSRIFYESFGPATVLKPETAAQLAPADAAPVPVRFVRSGANADWSRDRGTLLEFAESLGIAPNFGCRSGICGTCTTRVLGGAVDYLEEPVAPRGTGEVLLCCSVPRRGTEIVLDL
jgi:ferredoxin-NADP reductase